MRHPIMREVLLVTCTVIGAVIGLIAAHSLRMGDEVTVTGAFVGWSLFGGFAHICLTRSQ
jgi:uncharacterized protein YcfJ